jgi:4-hydroxyproline epimerase
MPLNPIKVLDSHTAGEPTRLVIEGGPDLGTGPLAARLERFRRGHDSFRSTVVNEPRGSDVLVGALLCEPQDPACAAGVIFFNNVGYLGMCGHGTIGLIASLAYLKRIAPGPHRIETPVGEVQTVLHASGDVTVANVASYRSAANVAVEVPGHGTVTGDIAWGGNWFYLVEYPSVIDLAHVDELTAFAWAVRQAINRAHPEVDHIELSHAGRNFVLCPGKAYDRSPCGTGTSAKLACLHADGKLRPGEIWRQASILDTIFEGTVTLRDGALYPSITGRAYITAEATLLRDPHDPFRDGIPLA